MFVNSDDEVRNRSEVMNYRMQWWILEYSDE